MSATATQMTSSVPATVECTGMHRRCRLRVIFDGMTMTVTSPVCLQLLPSWCTAATTQKATSGTTPLSRHAGPAAAFLVVRAFTYKSSGGREFIVVRAVGANVSSPGEG